MTSINLALTADTYALTSTEFACDMAHKLGAKLFVRFIRPDPRAAIPFMGEGLTAETIQCLCDASEAESTRNEAAAREYVEEMCRQYAIAEQSTFQSLTGAVIDHAGRQARMSDIAVVPAPNPKHPDAHDLLHDTLFRSGRLLIMVPEGVKKLGEHMLIAWNGSTECARAVGASLPLLSLAAQVSVVQLGDIGHERPAQEDLVAYLDSHDISCDSLPGTSNGRVAETILSTARTAGSDMILIGAYSHARWKEFIIGGVTKWLIQNSPCPLIMSH